MPKKKTVLILFIIILIFLSSCAETKFIITGETYPEWKGPVKIFQKPPKGIKYVEVGWISGKMGGMVSDWGKILEAMQKEAAKKGANGIILVDKSRYKQATMGGSIQYGFYGGSYDEKNLMAIAIRIIK